MTYDNDYETQDIYERKGQCYPSWPLVKDELTRSGAPSGTIGHWRYAFYSLQYCVAETESACQDILGCVWDGSGSGCAASLAVRAKSMDQECENFFGLDFDQYYDTSTPTLSDSLSGALAVSTIQLAGVSVLFTMSTLLVLW